MKSDEFRGKMLDDHIEVFCYCNFDSYRNLFWCFCIPIYEKEKGSCSGQYCLYWNYVCAVSDTAADWQFFCIFDGSCGCIWQIGDLYKKHIERGKAIHVQFITFPTNWYGDYWVTMQFSA